MAELAVQAGFDIEFATKDDVAKLRKDIAKLSSKYEPDWIGNTGVCASDGTIGLKVLDGIDGKRTVIGRIIVWVDGSTPASPYTNAALYWTLNRGKGQNNASIIDFPSGTYSVPNLASYSGRNAPILRPSEDLWFYGYGFAASANVTVMCQLWFERIWSQSE